ncbi:unnamed protein product [Effrenium voratum]|nr:unnamed protein product [Effrenium voratum]
MSKQAHGSLARAFRASIAEDRAMLALDKQLKLQEAAKKQTIFELEKDCREFSSQQLSKEKSDTFDLNDPLRLRKEAQMRYGDADPRCGAASMLKFGGEDLMKAERKRQQQKQQVMFIEQQQFEKEMLIEENSDKKYIQETAEMIALRNEMETNEQNLRKELQQSQQAVNLDHAAGRARQQQELKEQESLLDAAELYHHGHDPFLNECKDNTNPNGRVRRAEYKGATKEERMQGLRILRQQAAEQNMQKYNEKARTEARATYGRLCAQPLKPAMQEGSLPSNSISSTAFTHVPPVEDEKTNVEKNPDFDSRTMPSVLYLHLAAASPFAGCELLQGAGPDVEWCLYATGELQAAIESVMIAMVETLKTIRKEDEKRREEDRDFNLHTRDIVYEQVSKLKALESQVALAPLPEDLSTYVVRVVAVSSEAESCDERVCRQLVLGRRRELRAYRAAGVGASGIKERYGTPLLPRVLRFTDVCRMGVSVEVATSELPRSLVVEAVDLSNLRVLGKAKQAITVLGTSTEVRFTFAADLGVGPASVIFTIKDASGETLLDSVQATVDVEMQQQALHLSSTTSIKANATQEVVRKEAIAGLKAVPGWGELSISASMGFQAPLLKAVLELAPTHNHWQPPGENVLAILLGGLVMRNIYGLEDAQLSAALAAAAARLPGQVVAAPDVLGFVSTPPELRSWRAGRRPDLMSNTLALLVLRAAESLGGVPAEWAAT